MWLNNVLKALVERKGAAWKVVLESRDDVTKESCMEANKEEKREAKIRIY